MHVSMICAAMFRIMVQDQLGREVRCDPRLLHHQTGGRTVPVFMMLTHGARYLSYRRNLENFSWQE